MSFTLIGQIMGLAVLGLVLFIAVCYVVAQTVEYLMRCYFACKLAYVARMMEDKPSQRFKDVVAEMVKRHDDGKGDKVL